MKPYEVVYILDASLEKDAVAEKLDAFHSVLGDEAGAVDHWGVRRLAYPIAKARMGYYAVAHVTAAPSALPEFERQVKLDEQVLRYLIVLDAGQPASGDSIFAERPPGTEDAEADADEPATAEFEGGDPDVAAEPTNAQAAGAGASGEESADADAETEAALDANGVAAAGLDAAASENPEAENGETAVDEASGAGEQAEYAGPVAGPPEFSGAKGRSRRHDAPRILLLNYKDVATLSHFVNEQGRILPKRTTKVTARFQRQLGTAVKRARYLALLPYVRDHEA